MTRRAAVKPFKLSRKMLGDLDADTAARLIGVSADVALVIDGKGVIRDLAIENDELVKEGADAWIGRPWIDTVTVESRPKVTELLNDAGKEKTSRWRHVNHPSPRGRDLPVRYATVDIGRQGRIIAIGRDLRAMSALQQQIFDSQRQMDAEYSRLRQSETRYRALFYSTSEAVLVVDLSSLKVVEANPRANQLLTRGQRKVSGRSFLDLFEAGYISELRALLSELRTQPHAKDRLVQVAGHEGDLMLSASALRQESGETYVIARLSPIKDSIDSVAGVDGKIGLQRIVEAMPDAFVATDGAGNILTSNTAFLSLAQLATEDQVRGRGLDRWVGRGAVDMEVLLSNLREHGVLRRFNSVVRGEFGSIEDVEISAVSALASTPPTIGFVIRTSERREPATVPGRAVGLPRSAEQMTELVGRVPLRELVRETTDIIERMCIEAALQLTKDNRASAAEMLGLSRQGLYIKLRRYGIGDIEEPSNE